MRYPIALHTDDGVKFGASVPDIPGCFSAGDTIDECLELTKEAIESHVELLAEDGIIAAAATPLAAHTNNPDYKDATWAYVDASIEKFSGKAEKVNVTIPKLINTKINDLIERGKTKNRSAFLAEAAIEKLAREA